MKKALLLVIAAIAASALAAPTMASAAEWTRGGNPLAENAAIELKGPLTFTDLSGAHSLGCNSVTMKGTLEPGSAGTISQFLISWPTCFGKGIFAGCTAFQFLSPQKLPWALEAQSGGTIGFKGVSLLSTFSGFLCPKTFNIEGDLVGFPNNPTAITSVTFNKESGKLKTNIEGLEMNASGTMNATFSPAGTYGIK